MSTSLRQQRFVSELTRTLGVLGTALLLGAGANPTQCSGAEGAKLRVAIAPEYPPLVFRQPEGTNGVEIDLAKALGAELNRPVEFVVLRWDQLIQAVVENQADIIMSGMSITKARQLRIAFSEPYLRNQVRAIFRQKDAARFKTVDDILGTTAKIGVIAGTTADVFVVKNCPNAERVIINNRPDVPILLIRGGRMDVYVDDTYALAPMVAANEAEIAYLPAALAEDNLGWGVRQSDRELLDAVNRALAKWKTNGTLERTLDRWMPYLKNVKAATP